MIKLLVLIVSVCLFQSNHLAYSSEDIVLPPMPKSDDPNSILGTDVNKNGVRDDVEHFIYNEITKDPQLFKAYINYAESYLAGILNFEDRKLIRKYAIQNDGDLKCIAGLNPDFSMNKHQRLYKEISNTKLRKSKTMIVTKIEYELDLTIKGLKREEKVKLCRN